MEEALVGPEPLLLLGVLDVAEGLGVPDLVVPVHVASLDGDRGRSPEPRAHVLGGGAVVHVPVLGRRHLHHELDDLAVVSVEHPRERPRRRRLVAEVRAPTQGVLLGLGEQRLGEALPDRLRARPEGLEVLVEGEALVLVAHLPPDQGAHRAGVDAGGRGATGCGEEIRLLVEDSRRAEALVGLHLGLGIPDVGPLCALELPEGHSGRQPPDLAWVPLVIDPTVEGRPDLDRHEHVVAGGFREELDLDGLGARGDERRERDEE